MSNEEIEKAVLFYIIFKDEQCDLSEKDFSKIIHQKIIKAINSLKAKKENISIITIANLVDEDNGTLLNYLSDLGQYIFNTSFDTAYKILKEYTKKREVYKLATDLVVEVINTKEVDNLIEENISKLEKIELQTEKDLSFTEQVNETLEKIEKRILDKEKRVKLFTGIFKLDGLTDGLHGSELTVIGARPRCRKDNICTSNIRKRFKVRKECSIYKFRNV
jgi:replicative DNA helicase